MIGMGDRQSWPDDPGAWKAIVAEKDERIAFLEGRVRWLERALFGPRSEKRSLEAPIDSNGKSAQGQLLFPELLEIAETLRREEGVKARVEVKSAGEPAKKPKGRRKQFPPHLPRIETVCELPREKRTCDHCGEEMEEMGEEVRRELERLETTLVHEIVRKKYSCRKCQEGVKIAAGPPRVIDKGILGAGFLAHVVTERFLHHMPYHRQERKYATEGLDLSRSVLCESSIRCAELLEPIAQQLRRDVLSSPVIGTDDTPVVEQQSSEGGRALARMWVYHDLQGRHVFDFTESRKRDGPLGVLEGFGGYVQADAFSGYDALYLPDGAREVACMAHVRRKFVDAEATDPKLAKEALDRIGTLYAVEKLAKEKGLGAEARRRIREEQSTSLLAEFRDWMAVARTKVLDKSPLARAIDYAFRLGPALGRYLEDGRLEIDNNASERALRKIATGRKNWSHVGNEGGGKAAAILYSLVVTADAIGIDPKDYLRDVLLRISKCSDPKELTPHGWKAKWMREAGSVRQELLDALRVAVP